MQRPVTPLTSSIRVLRRQLGLGEPGIEDRLASAWRAAAGDDLAALTSFIEIRRGRLFIGVDDAAAVEVVRWKAESSRQALSAAGDEDAWTSIVVRYVRPGERA